ncbi:MAG: hypothetical protein ACUVS2_11480 [Candidatus Flexifilum sp.]|jgi:hypothetical protein
MSQTSEHPLSYRQREVSAVMDAWRSSASCSLVGVGSVGKSNLIQHLAAANVQAHYLGADAASFKAIWIDPFLLGALGERDDEPLRFWAGCELLMNRLYRAFQPFDLLGADARVLYETYQAFQDGSNPLFPYLGLRYLDFALNLFFQRGIQIVFMFDEFEHLLRQMPVSFFLGLRGLRDARKHQLAYMTFTRVPLPQAIADAGIASLAIEPFAELFTDRVIYVGPYSQADAAAMLTDLMRRKEKEYDSLAQGFLLWATGGHAGLLRAAAGVLDQLAPITMERLSDQRGELLARLAARGPVRAEAATIWNSLPAAEREALRQIRDRAPVAPALLDRLAQKALIERSDEEIAIQPPLLAEWISRFTG